MTAVSPARWRALADELSALAAETSPNAEITEIVIAGALLQVAARLKQRADILDAEDRLDEARN